MLKDFLQGKWLGHPLHSAIVHLPTALWPAALVFDVLSRLAGGNVFVQVSFFAILAGLAAALLAIPTGLADWSDIKRDKPAWKIGLYHMLLNLSISALQAVNAGLRLGTLDAATVATAPLLISVVAVLLLLVSGYLGGRMVYNYGISVARQSKEKWRRIAEDGGARVP